MKNVIITGANGMIGSLILQFCLQNKSIHKITTITRKPLLEIDPKVFQIIHSNFLDFSSIEHLLVGYDVCYYCIGVYTGQVPTDKFKEVTVDYTATFAKALSRNSLDCNFCFLSGQGADNTEKSNILFAREKGIAENILIHLNFKSLHIFRPGYIYPDKKRVEPNLMYIMMRKLYKPIKLIYPNIGVTAINLAKAMLDVGLNDSNIIIYENEAIRKYVFK